MNARMLLVSRQSQCDALHTRQRVSARAASGVASWSSVELLRSRWPSTVLLIALLTRFGPRRKPCAPRGPAERDQRYAAARVRGARKNATNRANRTALSFPGQPNELWCADYKGEFMLADRRYCYPLGSLPSWTTISGTSTTRPAGSNRSRTPSDQKCYPCLRNKP